MGAGALQRRRSSSAISAADSMGSPLSGCRSFGALAPARSMARVREHLSNAWSDGNLAASDVKNDF